MLIYYYRVVKTMTKYAVLDTSYVAQNGGPNQRIRGVIEEGYILIIPSLIESELPGKVSPELIKYLESVMDKDEVRESFPTQAQEAYFRSRSLELCSKQDDPSWGDSQVIHISLDLSNQGEVLVLTSDMHIIAALCSIYSGLMTKRLRNGIDTERLDRLKEMSIETHENRRFTLTSLYECLRNKVYSPN